MTTNECITVKEEVKDIFSLICKWQNNGSIIKVTQLMGLRNEFSKGAKVVENEIYLNISHIVKFYKAKI